MKLLWLASWYPSKVEPFNGDFVQRHAQAVSLQHEVVVLHVIKDPKGSLTSNVRVEERTTGRLTVRIVYYRSPLQSVPIIGRLFSAWKYKRVFRQQLRAYLETGLPDRVHVHVSLKAGLLALWLKKKYRLPYVLTEHSTAFLSEATDSLRRRPFYYRRAAIRVLQNASAVSVVSHYLGKSMQPYLKDKTYTVIPNVVDTSIFKPVPKQANNVVRFVHVSGLNYQKNPEAILDAFALLKGKHTNFRLDVFGPRRPGLVERTAQLGLAPVVSFYNEVSQEKLAAFMQAADALILFSRYETFGCVLIEANACGTPVVVSDIAVMHETVADGVNGVIVPANATALANALANVIEGKISFDADRIAKTAAETYGYEPVAEAFSRFYRSVAGSGE